MKPSQVKEQVTQAERSLSHAALACEGIESAPGLRRRLAAWQRECEEMRTELEHQYDAEQVRARVDALEQATSRLVEKCRRRTIDEQVEIAVEHAHAVFADLKEKLH